jgi:glyoxylase-like metal-dependent hydrolase (beta-lactamase superfamily II)
VEPVTHFVHLIYKSHSSTDAPFEGNVVVVEQSSGLVVIDAGGSPASGRHVVEQIRSISRKPVRWLIYTHYHGDHNLGAGAFRRAWPDLHIVSTDATRRNMTGEAMAYVKTYDTGNQGTIDFAAEQLKRSDLSPSMRAGWQHLADVGPAMIAGYKSMSVYPADVTFARELILYDAVAPVEIRFLGRANTDGDAVIWLPKQRVLASGDIVVMPIPYASASFPAEWIDVLKKLDLFDYAFLIPGHGAVQTDHRYIGTLEVALQEIRSKVQALVDAGQPLEDVQKNVDLESLKAQFAGSDEFDRFLLRAFFLRAIVSNAYKEAKGEPIVQGKDGG